MMTRLYMAVTPDELELPLFVTDNCKELAQKYNTSTDTVYSQITRKCDGSRKGVKFVKVIIDDEVI